MHNESKKNCKICQAEKENSVATRPRELQSILHNNKFLVYVYRRFRSSVLLKRILRTVKQKQRNIYQRYLVSSP